MTCRLPSKHTDLWLFQSLLTSQLPHFLGLTLPLEPFFSARVSLGWRETNRPDVKRVGCPTLGSLVASAACHKIHIDLSK